MLKRAFESFYINICIAATFLLACGNTEKEVCASIGNMELAVVLKDGGEIREVQWLITHHNGYSKDGVIDVNDPAAKISGYISNVPADEGYHIALSAITTESGTCGGAADFNIVSKKVTQLNMMLHCHEEIKSGDVVVAGSINICPQIDYLTVSPTAQGVGKKIEIFSETSDADEDSMRISWSATPSDGVFDNPSAATTKYECNKEGTIDLTLSVTDEPTNTLSDPCITTKTVEVECILGGVFDDMGWGSIMLGRPTDTSISINVVTDVHNLISERDYEIYFEYGVDPTSQGMSFRTVSQTSQGNIPIVEKIEGLTPDTEYYYRMRYRTVQGDRTEWLATETKSFHTQRSNGEPFVFTVQSDSHLNHTQVICDESIYRKTVSNIINDNPDLHFDVGDTFINKVGSFIVDGVILGDMNTIYPNYLDQRKYLGKVGRVAPVFIVVGNHENEEGWNMDDTDILSNTIPFMSQNARKRYYLNPVTSNFYSGVEESWEEIEGDHLRDAYYAFNWGDVLFIALDPFWYTMVLPFLPSHGETDDEDVIGDSWSWTLGPVQYEWLRQTLEESSAKYKFVFIHHLTGGGVGTLAGYGRGGAEVAYHFEWGGYNPNGNWEFTERRRLAEGWRTPVHQLLVRHGVDIVFHGHDHFFAKEDLDNIVYQEVPRPCDPNPGNDLELGDDYQKAIAEGNAQTNSGHLRVTVSEDDALVEYVRYQGAEVTYEYEIDAEPTNSAPLVEDMVVYANAGQETAIHLSASDNQEDELTYSVIREPVHGQLTGSHDLWAYTPNSGYSGSDFFIYQASDGSSNGNIAYVDIEVLPMAPQERR